MSQSRHQATSIDLTKGIDGDSQITNIREGFAIDLINCRAEGGVLEKRTGYDSIGNFPIHCSTSGTTLTFTRSYYAVLGSSSYPATYQNVGNYLGISGVEYSGWYIHSFTEGLPSNAVLVVNGSTTPIHYLRITDNTILSQSPNTSWGVYTAPSIPVHRIPQGEFSIENENGALAIVAGDLPLQLYDLICFSVPYFGVNTYQRGKVTQVGSGRAITNIPYVGTTNLPWLEFYYLPEKWVRVMPSSTMWLTGIVSSSELTTASSETIADTYAFGLFKDTQSTTHFMNVWEGNIIAGHNNRIYTLPVSATSIEISTVTTLNGATVSYTGVDHLVDIPTSVLPNTYLCAGCELKATYFDREFTGTVMSKTTTSTNIRINNPYWDILPSTNFSITYMGNWLPPITGLMDFDVLLINSRYVTVLSNIGGTTLNTNVEVSSRQKIYSLPRMVRHAYGDLNPLWIYGQDLPLQTTSFSEGVYIQAIEGGVLRYNGKEVINLTKFNAPTLPLVRSVTGTHGSLEVASEATLKDGYAQEQQIIITYYIEEWNGGSIESMITPNYDCITRPAMNPDGSQYASWLELAVPTLPADVASLVGGKIKIRVYRRPATSTSSTICKLEVEVDNDTTVPYVRVLIGDKFNFNQDEKKELYADVFRFSNVPAPRGSTITTFGNNLNVANVVEPPLIEIVGEKVFDFEQKGTSTFVGDLYITSPAGIQYRMFKLGKDTVSDGTAWVYQLPKTGSTKRSVEYVMVDPNCNLVSIYYTPWFVPSFYTTSSVGILRYVGTLPKGLEWMEDLCQVAGVFSTYMTLTYNKRRKTPLPPQVTSSGISGFYFFKRIFSVDASMVGAVKDGCAIYISEGEVYLATVEGGSSNTLFSILSSTYSRFIFRFTDPKEDTLGNIRQMGNSKVLSWGTDLFVTVAQVTPTKKLYVDGHTLLMRAVSLFDRNNVRISNYSAVEVTHTLGGNGHGAFEVFAGLGNNDNGTYKETYDFLPSREYCYVKVDNSAGINPGDMVSLAWEDNTTGEPVQGSMVPLPAGYPALQGSFKVISVGSNVVTIDAIQVPDEVPMPFTPITTTPYQGKRASLFKPSEILNKINSTTLRVATSTTPTSSVVGKIAFMINRDADYDSVDMQLSGYYSVTGYGSNYVDLDYPGTIDLSTLQGFIYGRLVVPTTTSTLLVPCPKGQDISERLTDLAYPLFSLQSDEAYTSISILRRYAYAINSWEHDKYHVYYGGEMSGGISPYPSAGIQIQFRDWIKRTSTTWNNGLFPEFSILGGNYTVYGNIGGSITSSKTTNWTNVRPALISYSSRIHWTEKETQLDLEKAIPQFTNKMYQDVYGSEGDSIMAVVPLKENGIIFKNKSIWGMSLQPAQDGSDILVINRVEAPTGCSQPFNIVSANDTIYYISSGSGVYVCDGIKSAPLPLNEYFERNVYADQNTQYGFCDPFDEVVYLGWNDSSGSVRRFALGFTAGNVTTDLLPFTLKGYAKFGDTHLVATNTGLLISTSSYSDEGSAIKMTVDTPYISLDPTKHKFFRSVVTNTYSSTDYSYTQAVYYSYGTSSENLVEQSIQVMASGRQEFGGSLYKYERKGSLIPRNSSIRLRLEEESGNEFQVQGVSVLFQPMNETRIPQQGSRMHGKRY